MSRENNGIAEEYYTRDGNFQVNIQGYLVNNYGDYVLDKNSNKIYVGDGKITANEWEETLLKELPFKVSAIKIEKLKKDEEEVDTNITSKVVTNLQIPNTFDVEINVTDYKPGVETESYVKVVKINLKYFYYNETQNFSIDKLKIKEL